MPEFVDLVDKSGRICVRGVPRQEANQHPELHVRIVVVVIVDDMGRVLVQRRAMSKAVNPGDIDHVCGAVHSGEAPLQAAIREVEEEAGVTPRDLRVITHGINEYSRYRYLLAGMVSDQPRIMDPHEVAWVGYEFADELHRKYLSGELSFVTGFFADLDLVSKACRHLIRSAHTTSSIH